MTAAVFIIATSAVLFGATIGILTVLVIGIRRDDRSKTLTDSPRSSVEAATRRLLGVGVRNAHPDEQDEEEK
jgi:hypothetical protein